MDRNRESNFQKERDYQTQKKGKSSLTNNNGIAGSSGFGVLMGRIIKRGDPGQSMNTGHQRLMSWIPVLAVLSTVTESTNGSMGTLFTISSDEEIEFTAEKYTLIIDVCIFSFHLAICTASLYGNITTRKTT